MLRLVLPKGSLEHATLQLFEDADLAVVRSSDVDYRASIDDPRVIDVTILRPQEIPRYVADGLFDVGITGRDWIEETERRRRHPRRAALFEGDRSPDPHGARRRGRLVVVLCVRSAPRGSCAHRVPGADAPVSREARCRRPDLAVVRRDRGQDPGDRRRRRRDHRDRPGAARRRAADPRHDSRVVHRAHREPDRVRGRREAPCDGAAPDAVAGCARSAWPRAGEAQCRRGEPRRR